MQKLIQVEPVTVTDVRNRTLYYIKIGEGENQVIINTGAKTYENVKKLTDVISSQKQKESSKS